MKGRDTLDANRDRIAERVDSGGKGYNSISGYYTFAASGLRLVEWIFRLCQLTPNGGQLEQKMPVSIGQVRPGAQLGHKLRRMMDAS